MYCGSCYFVSCASGWPTFAQTSPHLGAASHGESASQHYLHAVCIVIAMRLGRTITMRTAVLTLLGSLVLSAAAMPANAGPAIAKPGAPTVSNVIQVSGGCGQRYYRD